MNRSEILDTAKEYVTKDRDATHGDAERSFEMIAAYWSNHLGVDVHTTDVAIMMTLLKLARLKENHTHEDSWIDVAGYAACGGEIATEEPTSALAARIMATEVSTSDLTVWR